MDNNNKSNAPPLTMLSLFDGSGGFPQAGLTCGIEPVFASEVEPFAIRVTTKRLPQMMHLGDINKINGAEIPPVDVVTGGFCCFPAGTLVFTDTGYRPIEDIKIGDTVLTHAGRWQKVTDIGARESETVLLKGNTDLETTAEHPIYSADMLMTEVGRWTEAAQMGGETMGDASRRANLGNAYSAR